MHQHLKKSDSSNVVSFFKRRPPSSRDTVYLMKGEDEGKSAWYYLMVEKLKLSLLQHDLEKANGANIDLTKYGEVLKYGWGEEPPEHVVKYIEENYG